MPERARPSGGAVRVLRGYTSVPARYLKTLARSGRSPLSPAVTWATTAVARPALPRRRRGVKPGCRQVTRVLHKCELGA